MFFPLEINVTEARRVTGGEAEVGLLPVLPSHIYLDLLPDQTRPSSPLPSGVPSFPCRVVSLSSPYLTYRAPVTQ